MGVALGCFGIMEVVNMFFFLLLGFVFLGKNQNKILKTKLQKKQKKTPTTKKPPTNKQKNKIYY